MPKRIVLVAAGQRGRERVTRALSSAFDLEFASSVDEAKRRLLLEGDSVQCVLCDMHFDESRMFELLEYMRSNDGLERVPFVAVQFERRAAGLTSASKKAAEMLGACTLVELDALPPDDGDRALHEAVETCSPIHKSRTDASAD